MNDVTDRSVEQLLEENADYLVNDVSLRLRHYGSGMYPMAPTVLKVIIQYSSRDIVTLLDDTIQEVSDRHWQLLTSWWRVTDVSDVGTWCTFE